MTRPLLHYIGAGLMAYGVVGVAVNLRLLPLLGAAVTSWVGLPSPGSAPAQWDLLGPLQSHFDVLPWLPWAAWLAGLAALAWPGVGTRGYERQMEPECEAEPEVRAVGIAGRSPTPEPRPLIPKPSNLQLPLYSLLLVLLIVGGYARLAVLWPQSVGLTQLPYDDEGVYAGASQLFLQGILPYRDYFFAHPPVAAISYAPAMAYHFNEWGSPTSFIIARYLSVAYSLATLALIFFIAYLLSGLWGGFVAGGLWALDGRVVEINRKVMLDGPMVLLACAALLLYLWARPWLAGEPDRRASRGAPYVLALAGALAALSALTKIAGVACLLAILADMAWLRFDSRRRGGTAALSIRVPILTLVGGALVALLLAAGPFLAAATSQFLRQVLFFQLLRPGDGLVAAPERIADLTSTYANALTPLLAALGCAAVTIALWRRNTQYAIRNTQHVKGASHYTTQPEGPSRFTFHVSPSSPWRLIVLWTFFSLLLFTYSRSFYGHYYIQLAAPLCLLGAGVALLPGLVADVFARSGGAVTRWARAVPAIVLLLLAVPPALVQWNGVTARREDSIFEVVARYVTDAVPPGAPVLTTDEQFNFLAARPPSFGQTGYLIDSYGQMIYLGMGLDARDWGDLTAAALRGQHGGNDPYAVMHRPAPQADMLDRARRVPLLVIHDRGAARLTPGSLEAISRIGRVVEQTTRYAIYRVNQGPVILVLYGTCAVDRRTP